MTLLVVNPTPPADTINIDELLHRVAIAQAIVAGIPCTCEPYWDQHTGGVEYATCNRCSVQAQLEWPTR